MYDIRSIDITDINIISRYKRNYALEDLNKYIYLSSTIIFYSKNKNFYSKNFYSKNVFKTF